VIWVVTVVPVIVAIVTSFKLASEGPDGTIHTQARFVSSLNDALAQSEARQKLRDPMPPIAGIPIMSAEAAGSALLDEDHVLGIDLAGESRAYAINMMAKPETEVLNDTLGGWPIAVTFCSKCQSPLVFSRQVKGEMLTFHLNGELLNENMLMRDVETGSDWVQLTGEAIEGPLKGHRLEQIPMVWTDWKTWRERYPETTLPKLPSLVQDYRHHPLYSAFPDERSLFSDIQWGLARETKARSWPYAHLDRQPVVNDVFAGQPLLLVFDRKTSTVNAYDRRTGDAELTFRWQANQLSDDQTGSIWDPVTGVALTGPLKGYRLTPVAGTISLRSAWQKFHPDGNTWSARKAQAH
jgi:hypothetical protein